MAVLLMGGCAGEFGDVRPSASPAPPTREAQLTPQMVGTWRADGGLPQVDLVASCGLTETENCGRLQRKDPDNGVCTYDLDFRGMHGDRAVFHTSTGRTMHCAWSGWSDSDVLVTLTWHHTIMVNLWGPEPPLELRRVPR